MVNGDEVIEISGQQVRIDVAAEWLVESYNPHTLQFYDYANLPSLDAARSPTDRVVLEDLGRLVCVAASLDYKRGHTLLSAGDEAPWPSDPIPPLQELPTGDDFHAHPAIEQLWRLFNYWDAQPELGFGTIGKLLHIKWPHCLPITDAELRKVYRTRAVELHNASTRLKDEAGDMKRRTRRANVRAYWLAFRDNLAVAQDALDDLRHELDRRLSQQTAGDTRSHVERVRGLTDVRLLDALVWGVAKQPERLT